MTVSKLRIIFVGAFQQQATDGSVGGQLYACRTLINSPISEHIEWLPLDSTMQSLPPPPLWRRFFTAGKRLFTFFRLIREPSVTGALIFTSAGWSFVEKGLMVLITKWFNKHPIFSPRSGLILDNLQLSAFLKRFIPFVLRRCDIILCQSQSWKQVYQTVSGLPDHRLAVIPNWLDPTPYARLAGLIHPAKETTNILYLGWLETYKGIFDLIEAVRLSQEYLQDCRFIICGRGSQAAMAEKKVVEYELASLFEFRGWVTGSDKLAVLSEADIFVLPSHREGLPNALLEAMVSELAVIATGVGGIPEVINDASVGRVVEAADTQALGRALVELHQNPQTRLKLGKNAKDRILSFYNIETIWPKLLHLFQNLSESKIHEVHHEN